MILQIGDSDLMRCVGQVANAEQQGLINCLVEEIVLDPVAPVNCSLLNERVKLSGLKIRIDIEGDERLTGDTKGAALIISDAVDPISSVREVSRW